MALAASALAAVVPTLTAGVLKKVAKKIAGGSSDSGKLELNSAKVKAETEASSLREQIREKLEVSMSLHFV